MTAEQLQRYCTDIYLGTESPFVIDGWLYATDKRVCIRVPTTEPVTNGNHPRANRLPMWDHFPLTDPKPLPELPELTQTKCKHCTDGYVFECDMCDGDGWQDTTDDDGEEYESVCDHCKGEGIRKSGPPSRREKCEECDGKGSTPTDTHFIIDGLAVSLQRLTLIRDTIPDVRVQAINRFLLFQGGDAQGILVEYELC